MEKATNIQFKKEYFNTLKNYILEHNYNESDLIAVLHKAQHIFGYLPKEVQVFIAIELKIPVSTVFGVVSFYSYFTMTPRGKYQISICTGTACHVRGAGRILQKFEDELGIKKGETTKNKLFTLDTLRCVGACAKAPVVLVNDDVYGKDEASRVREIIMHYVNENNRKVNTNELKRA